MLRNSSSGIFAADDRIFMPRLPKPAASGVCHSERRLLGRTRRTSDEPNDRLSLQHANAMCLPPSPKTAPANAEVMSDATPLPRFCGGAGLPRNDRGNGQTDLSATLRRARSPCRRRLLFLPRLPEPQGQGSLRPTRSGSFASPLTASTGHRYFGAMTHLYTLRLGGLLLLHLLDVLRLLDRTAAPYRRCPSASRPSGDSNIEKPSF